MRLTDAELRNHVAYDPATGILTWKIARRGTSVGWKVGYLRPAGYIEFKIGGRKYKAHRVAWFLMTGAWPVYEIDHDNRDRADNRWLNLREATKSQNQMNSIGRPDATSQYKGVSWDGTKWRAQIKVSGKKIWLGRFDTEEAAHAAYCEAAKEWHGEFARTS